MLIIVATFSYFWSHYLNIKSSMMRRCQGDVKDVKVVKDVKDVKDVKVVKDVKEKHGHFYTIHSWQGKCCF